MRQLFNHSEVNKIVKALVTFIFPPVELFFHFYFGFGLTLVKNTVAPMFVVYSLDYYSDHPPMSAVRRLLEMMPGAAKFSYVPLVYFIYNV